MHAKFFVLLLCLAAVAGDSEWTDMMPPFVSKLYADCDAKKLELLDCLKLKAISLLERVSRSDVIQLDESIKLVRESRADASRALSENEIESSVKSEKEETRGNKLTEMLANRISSFLGSHVLKIEFPKIDTTAIAKSLEEGRGKMKKTMGMFMMAAMMKAMMMIPLSIGTLFILAGKALIISKIALVLSLLITLKKLLAKPAEHVVHENHSWNSGSGSGGWDKRSYVHPESSYNFNQNPNAHNLAYNSYINH